jgi:hypothetical protein
MSVHVELAGGAFKSCRFSRNGQKGLFTVVNHQGSGHILYWHQTDIGEMQVVRQTRTNSFAAPITAFDISPSGTFLGTGTSEGDYILLSVISSCAPTLRCMHLCCPPVSLQRSRLQQVIGIW